MCVVMCFHNGNLFCYDLVTHFQVAAARTIAPSFPFTATTTYQADYVASPADWVAQDRGLIFVPDASILPSVPAVAAATCVAHAPIPSTVPPHPSAVVAQVPLEAQSEPITAANPLISGSLGRVGGGYSVIAAPAAASSSSLPLDFQHSELRGYK